MTSARLGLLAALGIACLASSVFLARTAPAKDQSLLDSIYN